MDGMDLAKQYDAKSVQQEVSAAWDAQRLWHAEPDARANRYSIVIPPPNVTGALHLGHALNNTLQDVLIRYHRMLGDNTVWLPGTDHAGIATQTVVDKRLQAEGKPSLKDYKQQPDGREQFIGKVNEWKDEYEARILGQLRAMGCSCDWDRTAFTMDDARSAAVREAFFQLFKAGLIYRGKRLVNWDPVSQTALSDDEVEMEEVDGAFYYLQYPVCDAAGVPASAGLTHVTVATTRPETMLGDTAVAINPKDPRAALLRGKFVKLPIVDRVIPIIEDDYVVLSIEHGGDENDPKAKHSSGFLKVTPAHDPNDYALGLKYNLAQINVMAPDASISLDHGWATLEPHQKTNEHLKPFLGLSREHAREHVVAWFRHRGLLEKVTPYRHSVGHSYRSHVPVEPYLSDQWYCKVTDERMAPAANALLAPEQRTEVRGTGVPPVNHGRDAHATQNGGLRFFPERYAKTYETWHNNIRDWCISRQLWWGHRIPAWKLDGDAAVNLADRFKDDAEVAVLRDEATAGTHFFTPRTDNHAVVALLREHGAVQDPDVLDTWFSSALWPMSTLGWPNPTNADAQSPLAYWNPTNILCTAREIITLWVSRMVMFNHFLLGQLPFKDVVIHAMIQDGHGQKMSKSLGNGVDPLDVIQTHGADALRFTLATMATQTQDVRMPVDLIDPHTGESFTPEFFTNKAGYVVMKPVQTHKGKRCASVYGIFSGEAKPTADMPLAMNTSSKFDLGRNFCNKLWNAARFVMMQVGGTSTVVGGQQATASAGESLVDAWILSRLARTIQLCNDALNAYRYDQYAKACYDFVWRDYCDWYLEAAKPAMKDAARREQTSRVLATCLDAALRLMHPAIPFITQKLYAALLATEAPRGLPGIDAGPTGTSIMIAPFPTYTDATEALARDDVEQAVERLQQIVVAIRQVRNDNKVDPKKRVPIRIAASSDAQASEITEAREFLEGLAQCTIEQVATSLADQPGSAKTTAAGATIHVAGVIDAAAGDKRRGELTKAIGTLRGRLSNESYLAKAPPKLVEDTKAQLAAAEAELATLT